MIRATFFVIAFVASTAAAGMSPIADSGGDFTADPSQGFNGWSYGYFNITNPAGFEQLPTFGGGQWTIDGNNWTTIGATFAHPHLPGFGRNNPEEHHAVRRWTSTVSGDINISGGFDRPGLPGDGSFVSIEHNGSTILSMLLTPGTDISYDLDLLVSQGDTVDFVVAPVGGIQSDGVIFSAIIVPAPGVAIAFSLGGVIISRRRR